MLKFIEMPVAAPSATGASYAQGFQDGYNKAPEPQTGTLVAYWKGREEGVKCRNRRGTSEAYDEGFKDGLTLGIEAVNPYPHNCDEASEWCIGLVHGTLLGD